MPSSVSQVKRLLRVIYPRLGRYGVAVLAVAIRAAWTFTAIRRQLNRLLDSLLKPLNIAVAKSSLVRGNGCK